MSDYGSFAAVYDELMSDDADYDGRCSYFLKLFKNFGAEPTLLLDLACGTGAFSNRFAKKGIEVIGIDASEEMLAEARQNSAELSTDVLFLCQKAEELDLYGTVDGAVCFMDSLNHITSHKKLVAALEKVSLFLEPGKLFLFDVNTVYKHRVVLADNTFVLEKGDVYCVWQNNFDEKKLTTDISLDFFVRQENDTYARTQADFSERAYTPEEWEKFLTQAGFRIEAVYDDLSENPPKDDSERLIYVCRKAESV